MVVFEEIDEHHFSLHWMSNLMPINGFKCDLLREMEREVIEFLKAFYIMSAREVVEYDRIYESDKKMF